ncbi:MAG TPA: protein translocase subunit SecD [Solirubrobacterales bacterium]|nr:protein translocase subunit SecD [Solirubrobacterales bacterium]
MGKRRRHLFVLLFVLGLIAVSALVIANKPTRLGLDLKGGIQLVLQGRPTPQQPQITGESMNRAVDIIRSGCDQLGVSEIEVSRVGSDQIQVGIPGATSVGRATECATKPARLFFYDWEPNLIGRELTIGGNPGQPPSQSVLKQAEAEWKAAGRDPTKAENQQLIGAGAFPTEYAAVKLGSEQPQAHNCAKCSQPSTYYLFSRGKGHRLIDGPEFKEEDLYVSPNGKERPHTGIVLKVPQGTVIVSEQPSDSSGKPIEGAEHAGWYALKDSPALSGSEITNPKQSFEESGLGGGAGGPIVTFEFTGKGRAAFQEVTRRIAQRGQARAIGPAAGEQAARLSGHFAVILDNEVKTRPIINFAENPDGINGQQGAQISGGFKDVGQAQELAEFLKRGALPINLKLISQSQVSASLGSEALHEGIKAGIIGLSLVVIFLLLYYRFLGLVASLALGAYGVIFFALVKLIPVTLTLPGIAGLVLTIGVAADSNIVIFERIKEEVRAGRSMSSAITAGYRRGIGTIVDANVVTLLTAFILFVLATAGVKGFAFMLGIGTIVSLLTAVVFTQALLGSMSRSRLLSSPRVLGAGARRMRWRFDFMGASRWFFSLSGTILLVGAFALATKQLNLGIDFKSGTRVEVALKKATNEEGVREALESAGISGAEVQRESNPGLGSNAFLIQSKTLQPAQITKTQETLARKFEIRPNGFNSTSVGPTFGSTIANSARDALIFSLLVICAYVAFRFDPKFAVPVLIALFHDILITGGVYALTGKEVTSGTVAAFLTILGYSLYDTIIVFDRIRENMPRMPRAAFSQIVNRSMSEVLTRSLATSFSTLLAVVSLLVFGGATLKDFAFAMLVGIASGTYSSIFIASPVLTAWKEREPAFARRRERIEETTGRVPAFADEIETAKLEEAEATEIEGELAAVAAPSAAAMPPEALSNGEPPAAAIDQAAVERASDERREREARRRERRQKRRKHGRNR